MERCYDVFYIFVVSIYTYIDFFSGRYFFKFWIVFNLFSKYETNIIIKLFSNFLTLKKLYKC